MSRCFSYPPPGYLVSQGSSQALIESIKLQKETVLATAETKKDRKREKKEKKERRKERKEKLRGLLPEKKILKSSSTTLKFTSLQKLIETENEQLERSSLTEEHAQPVSEQKPSTSSDSTQNSSKRKRDEPSVIKQEENSIRSNGNVIRIRLSSRKPNTIVAPQEPCTSAPSLKQEYSITTQEPCSTSGRNEFAASHKHQEVQVDFTSIQSVVNNVISVQPPSYEVDATSSLAPKSVIAEDGAAVLCQLTENKLLAGALPPNPDGEGCSTSGEPKSIIGDDDISVHPKSLDKKKVKSDLRYRDLFLNWVPPPLQMELESDDQDWLFSKSKNPDTQCLKKKPKPSINVPCANSFELYPRAQFIPEADIYALPFTVPF